MFTIQYYKEKFQKIPFHQFCEKNLEKNNAKCALAWLGVEDCHISKWYNISFISEAKQFNDLFIKYLYPVLKSKMIYYNELLLEQGVIVSAINDGDLKVCKPLNITHKTIKGRILQALSKIEKIIESEELLNNTIEAEFEVIN